MTHDSEELRAALLMITHKANEANIHRDEDDVLETIIEIARAALAAAPQRELLAKIVQDAMIRTGVRWDAGSSEAIADALFARGLRLPGDETMAWAAVPKDDLDCGFFSSHRGEAKASLGKADRLVRVAIRVVEGGDDAA